MYRKLFEQIVDEECEQPLRDVRDVTALLHRVLGRIADILDQDFDLSGDNSPSENEDE